MMIKTFILALILNLGSWGDHDIHVSVCDIIEKTEHSQLEVSVRIFYDDLLNAVGLQVGEELPEDYTGSDDLIEKFISKHLSISINGDQVPMVYLESVSYPPAVWTTFKIELSAPISEIEVNNSILIDLFDDQVNMVNLKYKGKKKVYSLDKKTQLLNHKY
jgi:hypothetical protein